jgi:uncharacterized LabA/DUF88 family protein
MKNIFFIILAVIVFILLGCVPAFGQNSSPPLPPIAFEKAMVFIDGTNLFYRLAGAKLSLSVNLTTIISSFLKRRQLWRAYLYTIEQHLTKAKEYHKDFITDGIRIVLGEGIPTQDGNVREKGVDALLVADLVYHAAVKNYDFALVVSTDTDFVQAIKRVEDFGCRTGVLGVCSNVPQRLKEACDQTDVLTEDRMLQARWAIKRP